MESIEHFFKQVRISNNGFADSLEENVTVSASADALEASFQIGIRVNNTLDILYYFQRSQNIDGGFGSTPEENSTFETTVDAIRGLRYLPVNSSQLHNWEIFNYLNDTAAKMLFENISKTTGYREGPRPLTPSLMPIWYEYITASFSLGFLPKIDTESMVQQLQQMQLNNGSYPTFQVAVDSILLLNLLGSSPRDADLAIKFILAFATDSGAFSALIDGEPSLKASYQAIRALNALNAIDRIEYKNALTSYILNLQVRNSGFRSSKAGTVSVHYTLLAVTALTLLNELDELSAPDVLQTIGFINFPPIFGVLITIAVFNRRSRK